MNATATGVAASDEKRSMFEVTTNVTPRQVARDLALAFVVLALPLSASGNPSARAVVVGMAVALGFRRISPIAAVGGLPSTLFAGGIFFLSSFAALGLSWTLGLLGRTRRLARGSREAERAADSARSAAERAAAAEHERARLARDMHDVVAHSLAVIVAQADGARFSSRRNPEIAQAALATIAGTARVRLAQ